eukprot:11329027-Alexandrium_andersonii.AAC.1
MSASLVGSEMCIRDSTLPAAASRGDHSGQTWWDSSGPSRSVEYVVDYRICLLYTSDAADDM